MIIINYWTNVYYEESAGDKIYCKTIHSAKNKLRKMLKEDKYTPKEIKEILKPLVLHIMDLKICMFPGQIPLLEKKGNLYNLYIGLQDIELY